jgi:hypothetical protein
MHYLVRKGFPGFSYFVHKFLQSGPGFIDIQIRCEERKASHLYL